MVTLLVLASATYVILVENSEDQRGKLCWIAVGKKLGVNLDKSLLRKQPVGTILQKSFMPLTDLLLSD